MDFLPRLFSLVASLVILFAMQGCAGESGVLKDTLKLAFATTQTDVTLRQVLNPNYRYLRLVYKDRPLLLVLGFIEQPSKDSPPIEVWYSGQAEVFKLQAGRLIATAGLALNLVSTRLNEKAQWHQIFSADQANSYSYLRERDLMPDYRFGLADQITIQRVSRPLGGQPVGVPRSAWVWLKEQAESNSRDTVPPSFFGFAAADTADKHPEVLYSIQCITHDVCFSFQKWTLADQAYALNQVATSKVKP